ncbi:cyclic-phosphate processing receiver domain-containing protein [Vibrio sinensis]|uniref:cyclic-phosphate processing receiver domain-containing protein n=1 Tax=Vibrio sinensis TaxID=2302434 RepID=UPI001A9CC17A|nr:cyclic-phosphate processing receiver domain-containing protein [Vibrio sinensis]
MKVFLDDCRTTPSGWTRTYTPQQTIDLLKTGHVEILSLDHDLGDDDGIGTGYDVLLWLEERVFWYGFIPPKVIALHSSNSCAKEKMNAAILQIKRIREKVVKGHICVVTPDNEDFTLYDPKPSQDE